MKVVKDYSSFLRESNLNESKLGTKLGSVITYIKDLVKKYKDSAWRYYMIFLKKNNLLPKYQGKLSYDFISEEVMDISKEVDSYVENFSYSYSHMINEKIVSLTKMGLPNVGAEELKDVIKKFYKDSLDVEPGEEESGSLMVWGAPGIGKTSILKQVSKELGIDIFIWHLASTDPSDFRGVPTIVDIVGKGDPKDERTVFRLPVSFPVEGPKGGILFFDEFNQASQPVLSAALPLINEHKFHDYGLPKNWVIIAAGNRPEDFEGGGGDVTRFEKPMAGRFSHYNYAPDLFKDFFPYAMKNKFINPDILDFLKFKPEYFYKLDPENPTSKYGWPSGRSWERASRYEYKARGRNWNNPMDSDEWYDIYQASVGTEAAAQYKAYLDMRKDFNEKDIENIFKKGRNAKKLPTQADKAYAVGCAISNYKMGKKFTKEEFANLLDYFEHNYIADISNNRALDTVTPTLANLHPSHPEIKGNSGLNVPMDKELHNMYWEFVKKWDKRLNTDLL